MSHNLKLCLGHLKFISKIKSSKFRKAILKDLSCKNCYFRALKEIAENAIKGNLILDTKTRKKLYPYKASIKRLCCKTKSKQQKRKLVIQSGGWLPIILPAVISIVSEIINGIRS